MSASTPFVNYRHPKERRYSASSYDHVFRLLVTDPERIISHLFDSVALDKWKRADIKDDWTQELASYLHGKHKGENSLVELFNGSYWPYWLTNYAKNTLRSKSSPFDCKYREKFDSSDEEGFFPPMKHAPEEREPSIDLLCPTTIRWLLRTKDFEIFTSEQKDIFLLYFDLVLLQQKKITIRAAALSIGVDYRVAQPTISAIRRKIAAKIKSIEEQ